MSPEPVPESESPPKTGGILSRCAVLAGLCSLIPIPFLDHVLLRLLHTHMVGALVRAHRVTPPAGSLKPIYAPATTCGEVAVFVLLLPLKLAFKVLAKLLKTLFFFLGLRAAGVQVGHTLFLGRCVERCLQDGRLSAETDPPAATRIRAAYEQAVSETDWASFRQALSGIWRGTQGILRLVFAAARRVRRGKAAQADPQVEELSEELEEVQEQPAMAAWLAKLDERFDAAFSRGSDPGRTPSSAA